MQNENFMAIINTVWGEDVTVEIDKLKQFYKEIIAFVDNTFDDYHCIEGSRIIHAAIKDGRL